MVTKVSPAMLVLPPGLGTVTSVDVAGSTGLSVSGNPVTTSGTITLTLSTNLQGWSGQDPLAYNAPTASSAATLTTARTINGTSFNGSAAITTANWGTARTITIGGTGKSVNGGANVSWTLTELGAAPTGPATASGLTLATSRLLGRTTAAAGAIEEISVGTGLSLASTTLSANPAPYNNIGTYAARPAANTLPAGAQYYASDVKELYRSTGSAWDAINPGGAELASVAATTTFSTASTTYVDVTGMSVTPIVGERPIYVTWGSNMRVSGGGELSLALVVNGTVVSRIIATSSLFITNVRTFKVTGLTAGSTPTIKLQVKTTAGTADVYADATDPRQLLVVNA